MAKTPEQRGPVGAWLVQERKARGWHSAAIARAGLERAGILRVAPSVYAEWEAGTKKPNADTQSALERFYGSAPKQPSMGGDAVADAIREQNDWMRRYIEQTDARITFLEQMVAQLMTATPSDPADLEPELHGEIVAFARRTTATPSQSPTPDPTHPEAPR